MARDLLFQSSFVKPMMPEQDTLYKKLPVSVVYFSAFANIIQQNPKLVDTVFDFRNFM